MPVQVSYPGVYIEEIPSGVRTITGVATSIAAFIGRALKGPVDEPVVINGFGDFERVFGGLWAESSLGPAVQDFFQNGGGQAIVVRLYQTMPDPPLAELFPAELDAKGLKLEAVSPGAWGNTLRARVEEVSQEVADQIGIDKAKLFNLSVHDTRTGLTEKFLNLMVENTSRRADDALSNGSRLVKVKGALPAAVPAKHADPTAGKGIWDDDGASSKVAAPVIDGAPLQQADFTGPGKEGAKKGLYALQKADLFNILCIPPYKDGDVDADLVGKAAKYCEDRRAMLLVDPPSTWNDKDDAKAGVAALGTNSKNAALFFPRLRRPNPSRGGVVEDYAPCGAVAGVFARTDTQRGVWKAPAGLDATLVGVPELSVPLTDAENGELNPLGINCLRAKPAVGRVVWGARTLQGNDVLASEWKYIPVRRLALFIGESLYRGTQWVVFEPNDEPLWAQIRMNVGAFMHNLFRQGAFQGASARDAYLVRCDKETTTQNDINLGIVNIVVGFAPLKPAEFVIVKIQQLAGQIAT
jgi:phage tail sheath protein FI